MEEARLLDYILESLSSEAPIICRKGIHKSRTETQNIAIHNQSN